MESNLAYYIGYIVIALPIALYLTIRSSTKCKFVTFIIVYWLFTGPVLSTECLIIDIQSWYFDIQPARLIFVLFSVYLIIKFGMSRYRVSRVLLPNGGEGNKPEAGIIVGNPLFEKFLYFYLAFYFVSNLVHLGDVVTPRELMASFTNLLVFPILYLVLKKTTDEGMIEAVSKALIITCIVTSIVGLYQFFVDPEFFRWGFEYSAFGEFKRANGIYWAEYLQGSFLLTGIVVTLTLVRFKLVKIVFVVLFLAGIICTFHRATWIITIMVFLIYILAVKRIRLWQFALISAVAVLIVYFTLNANPLFFGEFEDTSFVTERLNVDTMTDRVLLYNMALRRIPQYYLFGVGSTNSEVYFHGVMEVIDDVEIALGKVSGIHNLFLLTAFLYGVPAALALVFFCITCLVYFWGRISSSDVIYMIPFSVMLIYFLQNLLNVFFLHHDFGLLLAIFCGAGVAIYRKKLKFFPVCKQREMVDSYIRKA